MLLIVTIVIAAVGDAGNGDDGDVLARCVGDGDNYDSGCNGDSHGHDVFLVGSRVCICRLGAVAVGATVTVVAAADISCCC